MKKRKVSTRVFLCFMMMMFLMVVVGCSGSDDNNTPAPSPKVGDATITGTVSGTTIVAIDESDAQVQRVAAKSPAGAQPDAPKTFTIKVPITHPTVSA